ncbi:MAG: 50S ribosomal protein L29 [Promethearchaeota archaeon]
MPKIITAEKIRNMDDQERRMTLNKLRGELLMLRSIQTGGGLSDNPAKAKILKKQIARILTVINEKK